MITNKKAAIRVARQARAHGFFKTRDKLWVRCPQCEERIESGRPSPLGDKTDINVLDEVMIDHLMIECQADNEGDNEGDDE